ncbi:transcriptional regulator [Pelistega indica]|uniref:Transcriptional regulator n=1 Tax=Pelistega indica TaxID=1414851 RepID=V8G9N1_9BURK|nr:nitric oxide reductase transcriptional regulator NorR [Pelistega indica]ETD73110.1 transcriptional regulator [Pelistega indica]
MIDSRIIEDLTKELSPNIRLYRLVSVIKSEFNCSAVGLLRLQQQTLHMVAAIGLSHDTLGRQFKVDEHPRLKHIIAANGLVHFDQNSPLPDPYDGLIDSLMEDSTSTKLHVHDCVGIKLHINNQLWGVLTLDAMENSFNNELKERLLANIWWFETSIHIAELESLLASRYTVNQFEMTIEHRNSAKDIIGNSPAILKLFDEMNIIADAELPVLIMGETGVGKDLVAHYIHTQSKRKNKPMVVVNCAALPDALAESELFGHVKGAFSGAIQERAGRFEVANNGTLFLDEIGELSLPIQAKLLRAIQNGEIQRLGSDTVHRVNVRIIAASNRNLLKAAEDGIFRMDLFHRLSVYPIEVPPLREREKDALLLAGHFLELNRARFGLRGLRLSPQASHLLTSYHWPGNVRELEHVISRAALKAISAGYNNNTIVTLGSEHLDLIDGHHLYTDSASASVNTIAAIPLSAQSSTSQMQTLGPLKLLVQQFEHDLIKKTLESTQYNWTQAAKILEIDASNLHKLAKKLGLKQ